MLALHICALGLLPTVDACWPKPSTCSFSHHIHFYFVFYISNFFMFLASQNRVSVSVSAVLLMAITMGSVQGEKAPELLIRQKGWMRRDDRCNGKEVCESGNRRRRGKGPCPSGLAKGLDWWATTTISKILSGTMGNPVTPQDIY